MRERYEKRLTTALATKDSVCPYLNDDGTTFLGEDRYHYTYNGNFLFVGDGFMFELGRPIDSKGLTRDPVLCQDDRFNGVRARYINFTTHCNNFGFYVHPIWAFCVYMPNAELA